MGDPMAMCNYEVFLSFRGPDVRKDFLKCFYAQLTNASIVPFKDDKEIEYGERIDDKIVEAIKRSYICIPVFSKDFASSPACLMEVAQMVESDKIILPIFYGVDPSIVRYQRLTYKDSFEKHVKDNRYPNEIKNWRAALENISKRRGLTLENVDDWYLKGLQDLVRRLWQCLRMDEEDVTENLVGTETAVSEMMQKLDIEYRNGRVVKDLEIEGKGVLVVWGLAGLGKTTLAKVVYNKIRHLFEGYSFIENVRDNNEEKAVVSLQNKLIQDLKKGGTCLKVDFSKQGTKFIQSIFKDSKVLIVLDDVNDFEQIERLAKPTWFGQRSRIILTTGRKDVDWLKRSEEQGILYVRDHEISSMNESDALELFCKCAFKQNFAPEGYDEMSRQIISAIGNHPLAINVVANSLCGRYRKRIWEETLDELKGELLKTVEGRLKKNFGLLNKNTKQIFLDIACFFTGVEKKIPCYMWTALKRKPHTGVGELQNMSFLKIGEKKEFWMHHQLKLLGRGIVKEENLNNPGKRSRLWDYEDVRTIMHENRVSNIVEALRVTPDVEKVDGEVFRLLWKLRFLDLDNVDIGGNLEELLPYLVWLDWRGCHEKSKLFAFNMRNLVILNLCGSKVKLNLDHWQRLMKRAGSLKVLNLKDCIWITASLEFPAPRHLERLILECCLYSKSNKTISKFEKLVSLNMKHCKGVTHLPQAQHSMEALQELLIDGTEIRRLHFEEDCLPELKILSACECNALREVTESIGLLKKLQKLTLSGCNQLNTLPHVFGELVLLQEMDLSYTSITELPPSIKDCKNLKVLKMARTRLERFPEAIKDLKELKELDFTLCGKLSGLCDVTGLFSLRILGLKGTRISEVLPGDKWQFCLDKDVTEQTQDACGSTFPKHLGENLGCWGIFIENFFVKCWPGQS